MYAVRHLATVIEPSRAHWTWILAIGGLGVLVVLAVLAQQVGAGPTLQGIRHLDGVTLAFTVLARLRTRVEAVGPRPRPTMSDLDRPLSLSGKRRTGVSRG